jgi:hypothetical protein
VSQKDLVVVFNIIDSKLFGIEKFVPLFSELNDFFPTVAVKLHGAFCVTEPQQLLL